MAGPGHNNGPTLEAGASWRRHCWKRAQKDLMPRLPIETVRRRVRRARHLGLAYATYARVYATTGQDIAALLFSSNALGIFSPGTPLQKGVADKLGTVQNCTLLGAAQPPLTAFDLTRVMEDAGLCMNALKAPGLRQKPAQTAARLKAFLRDANLPSDRVLVIGETALEQEWCTHGKMAGYLRGAQYFAQAAPIGLR